MRVAVFLGRLLKGNAGPMNKAIRAPHRLPLGTDMIHLFGCGFRAEVLNQSCPRGLTNIFDSSGGASFVGVLFRDCEYHSIRGQEPEPHL